MRFRHLMVTVVAFWMIGALASTQASASDFKLRIEKANIDGTFGVVVEDWVNIADPPVTGDEDPTKGVIQVNLSGVGGDISLTTGFSKPEVGTDPSTGILAELAVSSFQVQSNGASTIRLTLEDTGYPGPSESFTVPLALKSLLGVNFGTGNVGVSVRTYAATTYVPYLGVNQAAYGNLSGNPTGGVNISPTGYFKMVATDLSTTSGQVALDLFPNFNLFTEITLTFDASGGFIDFTQTSTLTDRTGEGNLDGTPEPASLMLISTSILGLVGARRRFKLTRGQ
jgi:hypothetical protein